MTQASERLSVDASRRIQLLRQEAEREFLVQAFDYFQENAVSGDVHEYGCDIRPLLPLAIETAANLSITETRFFGFAAFEEPRVVPGRAPRTERPLEVFVSRQQLEEVIGGAATLVTGPLATTLSLAQRDHFMNRHNKVALAILHAPRAADAKAALAFVEPLLTEGSLVYFPDLNSGYRRTLAKDVGQAFVEFQQNCRFKYYRFIDVGWWGRAYITCLPTDLAFEKL